MIRGSFTLNLVLMFFFSFSLFFFFFGVMTWSTTAVGWTAWRLCFLWSDVYLFPYRVDCHSFWAPKLCNVLFWRNRPLYYCNFFACIMNGKHMAALLFHYIMNGKHSPLALLFSLHYISPSCLGPKSLRPGLASLQLWFTRRYCIPKWPSNSNQGRRWSEATLSGYWITPWHAWCRKGSTEEWDEACNQHSKEASQCTTCSILETKAKEKEARDQQEN